MRPIEHLGLYILGLSLVISLVFVALGAVRVARNAQALKRRIDAYDDLAVLKVLEITEARLDAARRSAAGIPALNARARKAVVEIGLARARVFAIVQSVRFVVRNMLAPS